MGFRKQYGGKSFFTILLIALVVVLSFSCLTLAVASGGGEGETEGHGTADRSGDLIDLFYRFINFALLVIILVWALKKAGIRNFFSSRTEEIRLKLDELKKGKEEAHRGRVHG